MSDVGRLHRLFLRGSIFELAGYFVSQALRFGSNLLFTRLLYPGAYGLMTMAATVQAALILLTDVGIQQAVIQNSKGDDERFLNTAWTMQLFRATVLAVICAALAYPMAGLYREPQLAPLLLTGALQIWIIGWHSTSYYTLRRRVASGLLSLLDIGAQVIGIAAMGLWALFDLSVWALVAGSMATILTQLIVSHLLPVGYRNRFVMDRGIRDEIIRFGRWIMASSAVYFFARHVDRLLLGWALGASVLGVYSIASTLSEVVGGVSDRLTAGVLYPVFSRLGSGDISELRRTYYHIRLRLDGLLQTTLGVLCVFSEDVVRLLWDPRYEQAGWMLRILVIRVAFGCVFSPWETCLTATGNPRYGFLRSLVKGVSAVVGIPLAYSIWGLPGVLWATALTELPSLWVLWPPFRRLGLLRPARELIPIGFFVGGAVLALAVRWAIGLRW